MTRRNGARDLTTGCWLRSSSGSPNGFQKRLDLEVDPMPVNAFTAVRICTGAIGVLITVAGWFYAVHSRSAVALADLESDALNRRRVRLRRFGGCTMMALGACFFAGFNAVDVAQHPGMFEAIWIAVCLLLFLLLILAVVDLRLTNRLKRRLQANRPRGVQ
jgi:peptidoglycan/LPS O-acetylase OafA/YrhL